MSFSGRILIYGGRGALGSNLVQHFKSKNYWVGSIDLVENPEANANIVLNAANDLVGQESELLNKVQSVLSDQKVDAVICVAGGWAGGNSSSKDFVKNTDLMVKQSVYSSVLAAKIASSFLNEGGLLTLTGAKSALDGTPGMIGYGLAKASVHHLTKSLSEKDSGLPNKSTVVSILPVTLDTEMNRKWMPKADHTTWTPLSFVADLLMKWTSNEQDRPKNGSLVQLITKDSQTELVIA